MTEKLLDKINYPAELRKLKKNQLEQISNELKEEDWDWMEVVLVSRKRKAHHQ